MVESFRWKLLRAGAAVLIWAVRLIGDFQSTPWLHRGTEHLTDRSVEEKRCCWLQREEDEGAWVAAEEEATGLETEEEEALLKSEEAAEEEYLRAVLLYMTLFMSLYITPKFQITTIQTIMMCIS